MNDFVPEPLNTTPISNEDMVVNEIISNMVFSRMNWIAGMLDPRRDVNKECGYKDVLTAIDYRLLYDRDPIAARVVELEPKESWQVQPEIKEDQDSETETEFEKAWKELGKNLLSDGESWYQDDEGSPIWEALLRADIQSGIGHYGCLLIGTNDGRSLMEPIEGFEGLDSTPMGTEGMYGPNPTAGDLTGYDSYTTEELLKKGGFGTLEQPTKPANPGQRKITFLKVFDETLAQITRYERDPNNPRFGKPQMYLMTFNDPRSDTSGGAGLPVASAHVHWSRVIHLADKRGSNDVLAYPRLKQPFNRVWDLFKDYGASAEGLWQSAFSMLSLETNPQLGGDVAIDKRGISEQLANIRNKLQRHLVTAGMTAKTVSPTMIDPTPYINAFIEAICIYIGCPVRVFKGSERGELASSQDDSSWNDRLKHRQKFYLTPRVIVPFIDRLIQMKILPEPEGYSITWPDLEALSDKDKATIALTNTQAIQTYIAGNCETMMTPMDFLTRILHMDHDEAEAVVEAAKEAILDEDRTTPDPNEQMEEEPQGDFEGEQQDEEAATLDGSNS